MHQLNEDAQINLKEEEFEHFSLDHRSCQFESFNANSEKSHDGRKQLDRHSLSLCLPKGEFRAIRNSLLW